MTTLSKDPLVKVTLEEEWKYIENLMEAEFPKSCVFKCWLEVRRSWLEKLKIPFEVYVPFGNVKNGIVGFGETGGILRHVFLYQREGESWTEIMEALKTSNLIPWHTRIQFGVLSDMFDLFQEAAFCRGYKIINRNISNYYVLSKEKALSFQITILEDVYIGLLNESHVEIMNSNWAMTFESASEYLKGLIECNFGYGIFSKNDHTLRCWCIYYECGDLGDLETKKEFRRRGYAELLVKYVCRKFAEENRTIYAYILEGNKPSERLFKSLGFRLAGTYDFSDLGKCNDGSKL